MRTRCWNCVGNPRLMGDCETCEGTGLIDEPRLHVMSRRKWFIGRAQPNADANGNEKWARMTAEVPPEIAVEIDRIGKKVWRGHTAKPPSRSAIMRAALLYWMDHHDPEPGPPVEATAEEVFERMEIAEASVVEEGGDT